MCKIDFDHELGEASYGNAVYPTEDDLRRAHNCADGCGIVMVGVSLIKVMKPGNG